MHFENLTVKGDVIVGKLNGRSMSSLIKLNNPSRMLGTVHAKAIIADGFVQVHHSVNGRQLPEIWKTTLQVLK